MRCWTRSGDRSKKGISASVFPLPYLLPRRESGKARRVPTVVSTRFPPTSSTTRASAIGARRFLFGLMSRMHLLSDPAVPRQMSGRPSTVYLAIDVEKGGNTFDHPLLAVGFCIGDLRKGVLEKHAWCCKPLPGQSFELR